MQHEPQGAGESLAQWSDVHTVGDFIGYLAAYAAASISSEVSISGGRSKPLSST